MNTKQLSKLFSRMGGRKPSRNKSGWIFIALSGIVAFMSVMFSKNRTDTNGGRTENFQQAKSNMTFPPLNQMLTTEFAEEFIKKHNSSTSARSNTETANHYQEQSQGQNQH